MHWGRRSAPHLCEIQDRPHCIFAKCTRPACLLNFASLFWGTSWKNDIYIRQGIWMIDLLLLLLLVFGNAFITRVHIVSYLCVILCRLFSPQSANFLIRFQLFLAIQTFSSSAHSTGRPCDLKALFAPEILVKSCGFLMSDLTVDRQLAGSHFIAHICVARPKVLFTKNS